MLIKDKYKCIIKMTKINRIIMRYPYTIMDTQKHQYISKHANYLLTENMYLRSLLTKQQTLEHATWVLKIKSIMPPLFR